VGKEGYLRASGDLSDSLAALFLTGAKGWQPASCGRTKPLSGNATRVWEQLF